MSFAQAEQIHSTDAAAVRHRLLIGLTDVDTFAAAIAKTTRTVSAYLAQGMPATYIGRTPYIQIDEAGQWLRSRRPGRTPPRRVGRPRKVA